MTDRRGASSLASVGLLVLAIATCAPAGAAAQRLPERLERGAAVPAFLASAPVAAGRRPDSVSAGRVFGAQLVLGTAGSVGGFLLGAALGSSYYQNWGTSCYCDDPGLSEAVIGSAIGSVVGTAVGTHVGARLAGGTGGRWEQRLVGSVLGLVAGVGMFAFLHLDPDDAPPVLLVIPVTQAVVTALVSGSE